MKPDIFNVLIAGVGQIGSRYLQGLARCRLPLRIFVQDCQQQPLDRARCRWIEVRGTGIWHDVSFHLSLESIPQLVDIAIVATTADVRSNVVKEISNYSGVRYWVLEKVLAQSESKLDELISSVNNGSKAWVNTPRRVMPWHREIKSHLGLQRPLTLEVEGGLWGLASNAVHFLDLCAWWTGETIVSVSTERLSSLWSESNRPGFREVSGTLKALFSDGSRVLLSADKNKTQSTLKVSDRHMFWQIDETQGLARSSDGIEISGRFLLQSEMTSTIIESILTVGRCDLPTLSESVAIHRVFIRGMQKHWEQSCKNSATDVPIT